MAKQIVIGLYKPAALHCCCTAVHDNKSIEVALVLLMKINICWSGTLHFGFLWIF